MSKINVNTVDTQCGSTLTLGSSGKTVTLASGASQSGFGRTGTVDWCTTAKTSPFTSVSGKGYFVNTTSGAVTVTLPASPSAGDIVSIKDYANTFDTNNVTLGRNGSKIGGTCADATLDTEGDSITLVYVDGTKGWLNIQTDDTVQANLFVAATGGCVTTCGNFKIHTFNSDANFVVTNAGLPAGSTTVDYMVVAGGGGGGRGAVAGGGGAGGYRESSGAASGCYTASPLAACVSALPVSVQTYPISVGGGGTSPYPPGGSGGVGSNSVFSTITSAGGGGGTFYFNAPAPENNGGSGGGAGGHPGQSRTGGSGNTPPVSPPQGNNGGNAQPANYGSGGGGGAGAVGTNGSGTTGGAGGAGVTSCITASPVARAGGGGGGTEGGPNGAGGTGGGGIAGPGPSTAGGAGTPGTTNTGGGGGGASRGSTGPCGDFAGGSGGSGIVVIRYKYQ